MSKDAIASSLSSLQKKMEAAQMIGLFGVRDVSTTWFQSLLAKQQKGQRVLEKLQWALEQAQRTAEGYSVSRKFGCKVI